MHDIALKAAETDATKRALATFGKPFGLELYRGRQKYGLAKPLPMLNSSDRTVHRPTPAALAYIRTIRPRFRDRRATMAAVPGLDD